jgi:hypothetical protein
LRAGCEQSQADGIQRKYDADMLRRVRHLLLSVVIALILGALTNAAIAPAFVWRELPSNLISRKVDLHAEVEWSTAHPVVQTALRGPYVSVTHGQNAGVTLVRSKRFAMLSEDASGNIGERLVVQTGWPCRAFEGSVTLITLPKQPVRTERHWMLQLKADSDKRLWPVRPIWSGVACNAALFALLWLAFLPVMRGMRRSIRWYRGRCSSCGYDLRGDRAGGCPECGWRRAK